MKPTTMMIDEVKYVRADSINQPAPEVDGLKYAIVRSRNQGVMSGFVQCVSGQTVTLLRARQLWKWSSNLTLVDLAESGVRDKDHCKFSIESTQQTVMLEACGILYCTNTSYESIMEV